jgi:hypothetical protein
VARRAARQLLEVVGEQPVDQLALGECHRSGACQGCAPRPARRGRRRMPPRRSRPSPPHPRPARLRRRSPLARSWSRAVRSACCEPARSSRLVPRPLHDRHTQPRVVGAVETARTAGSATAWVSISIPPATGRRWGPSGGLGGPRPCPIRGPATRLATPSAPAGGTRARP